MNDFLLFFFLLETQASDNLLPLYADLFYSKLPWGKEASISKAHWRTMHSLMSTLHTATTASNWSLYAPGINVTEQQEANEIIVHCCFIKDWGSWSHLKVNISSPCGWLKRNVTHANIMEPEGYIPSSAAASIMYLCFILTRAAGENQNKRNSL